MSASASSARAPSGPSPRSAGPSSRARGRPTDPASQHTTISLPEPSPRARVVLRAPIPHDLTAEAALRLLEEAGPRALLAAVAAAASPGRPRLVVACPFLAPSRRRPTACISAVVSPQIAAALVGQSVALPHPWPCSAAPAVLVGGSRPSEQLAAVTGIPPEISSATLIPALQAAFPGILRMSRDTIGGVQSERYTAVLACTPAGDAVPCRIRGSAGGFRFVATFARQPLYPSPASPSPAAAPAAASPAAAPVPPATSAAAPVRPPASAAAPVQPAAPAAAPVQPAASAAAPMQPADVPLAVVVAPPAAASHLAASAAALPPAASPAAPSPTPTPPSSATAAPSARQFASTGSHRRVRIVRRRVGQQLGQPAGDVLAWVPPPASAGSAGSSSSGAASPTSQRLVAERRVPSAPP